MLYINKTAICNLRTFSFTAMRMTDDQLCMSLSHIVIFILEDAI